ncbi:hypothetical protein B0H12DRAFT_1242290 [Mycena haematopus]|nr:hypothetical protein B0H12DRAFT_1242290 [Mycena haematopus]
MAPRPSTSSKQKKTAAAARSSSSRRQRVSAREVASLEAERGSPPRPSGSTIYNQSVSDEEVEGSGDELVSSSYSVPINAPGPLLKHSHPDSIFWRAFDNNESRRIVTLFSTDGVNTTHSASSLFNILLSAAPIFLTYRSRFSSPIHDVEMFLWSTQAACSALHQVFPSIFAQTVEAPAGLSYTNLSGYLGLAPDRSVKQSLRAAAKGPLYLLGSDFHIPAVEASPMPKPVASSSKRLAPADDDSDVEMPAPSKKSRLQEVEVLVSSPPRPTARARKASPAASSSRKDAPPLRTSVAPLPSKRGAARESSPVASSSKKPAAAPALVRSTGNYVSQPSRANCRNGNTRCTFHPQRHRFGSLMEDLRPLLTLGPGALASSLLTAVRARQEADAAFRHLAFRLTAHEDAINEVVRTFSTQQEFLPAHFLDDSFEDPDDVQLLQQLSERVGANRLELELQYTDTHPTTRPFQRLADLSLDGAPDVYTQGYPPGVVAGPSTIDEVPGVEHLSRSVFAGADAPEADASLPEVDPRVNSPVQPVSPHLARATTPTFTALSLGRAGPLLQTPPTPSVSMPVAPPTTPLSKSVSFAPPPERPAYEQPLVYEQPRAPTSPSSSLQASQSGLPMPDFRQSPARPRLPASFARGGFTVQPARSQKPEPPSS